ncbi:MAG: hypothetical protein ABSB59_35380 [Streptosporangiaceae bacterium]
MRGARGAEYASREIVATWTLAGLAAGPAIGCAYGTAVIPFYGTIAGAFLGAIPGVVVGFLDGLLLAWIRPAPADVPLVAEVATELVLLPLQIWLWLVIHSAAFLPVVVAPSVASVAVAALLGRRLPPVPGRGGSRRRTTAAMSRWWSIEVRHGEVSAFRWQEQHDSALTEAALASGARDGAWHVGGQGVVFEVRFDTEAQWEAFRGLPAVQAALDAVPDPASGLLIYRDVAAGARYPRAV